MGTGLDSDVWVRDASSSKLAQGSKQEAVSGGHLPAPLEHLLQLLEDGVLENRVDDQDQSWQHAGEEACRTILTDDLEEGGQRVRRTFLLCDSWDFALLSWKNRLAGLRLACSHAGVDDPDRVCDQYSGGTSEGTRSHRLESGQAGPLHGPDKVVPGELVP